MRFGFGECFGFGLRIAIPPTASPRPFVFDFFCKSAGIAVEVDGLAHEFGDNPARDARRDFWAKNQGIETIRIAAEDVRTNLEDVMTHIVNICLERTPPPHSVRSPSPSNAGEDVHR